MEAGTSQERRTVQEGEPVSQGVSQGRFVGARGSGQVEHHFGVRVYYEDTDFSGVVYYARYLQFLERGRTEFLRCAGVRHAELLAREEPLVFAVRKLSIEYRQPARIDDALLVKTRLCAVKGARLVMQQVIIKDGVELVCADVQVASLTPDGRVRRVDAPFKAAVEPLLWEATF